MEAHITILIRTSNRPKSFSRCIKSILYQQYQHISLLVSVDNEATEKYVEEHNITSIKIKKDTSVEAPYNLYLNDLVAHVEQGWILILDDDDMLAPDAIRMLLAANAFTNPHALILSTMMWPNGRIVPEAEYLGKHPVRSHIGMPCFMVHHTHKHLLNFDGNKAGDFRIVKELYKQFTTRTVVAKPIVHTGNMGNKGKPIDI